MLDSAHERFQSVQIENDDWRVIMNRMDVCQCSDVSGFLPIIPALALGEGTTTNFPFVIIEK